MEGESGEKCEPLNRVKQFGRKEEEGGTMKCRSKPEIYDIVVPILPKKKKNRTLSPHRTILNQSRKTVWDGGQGKSEIVTFFGLRGVNL